MRFSCIDVGGINGYPVDLNGTRAILTCLVFLSLGNVMVAHLHDTKRSRKGIGSKVDENLELDTNLLPSFFKMCCAILPTSFEGKGPRLKR